MSTPNYKFTDDELIIAVKESTSYSTVLNKLKAGTSGSTYSHFKNRIELLGLNTEHFVNSRYKGHNKNKPSVDILIKSDNKRKRTPARQLRRALIKSGIKYECTECKIADMYNNKILRLQVDHINGDFSDNRIENLRFLCPNCHTQTLTYGNRSKKIKITKERKCIISEHDILEQMVDRWTVKYVASKLNVTEKTLRKYCKLYDISPKNKKHNHISEMISQEYFLSIAVAAENVSDIINKLKISPWQYDKLKRLYKFKFDPTGKRKNRRWITNGIADIWHDAKNEVPNGYWHGKTNNLPPNKQTKEVI